MKNEGHRVIRLGDKSDHGGTVTSVSSGTVVMGREAAIESDMTSCPECKGLFPIKPDRTGAQHKGKPYAYDNDITGCGARLISS